MLAKCYSGAVNGVDARMVEIGVYSTVGTRGKPYRRRDADGTVIVKGIRK